MSLTTDVDTRGYVKELTRVLRDYYGPELAAADASALAQVAAEVLTGATAYVDGSWFQEMSNFDLSEERRTVEEEGHARGTKELMPLIDALADALADAIGTADAPEERELIDEARQAHRDFG